ncbi:TniQ family protein [Achromobacter pulmonis]|uniref:TniQ family protein n=1 Tax=Achromobacter pulmonis TaxID=1389932 RepID=UPI001F183B11|nr:TniQ family protein [Achromobacter pulmonis]MCF7769495.1 TniQ family protein [Achromobacter pulmonis]
MTPAMARVPHGRLSHFINTFLPYPIEDFASSLGMQAEAYWRSHTLQPLYFFTRLSSEGAVADWAVSKKKLGEGFGFTRAEVVRYCPACVDEQKKTLGFAYWRREHFIPGADLCFEHELALLVVKQEYRATAFADAPGGGHDSVEDETPDLEEVRDCPAVQRYLARAVDVLCAIAGADAPALSLPQRKTERKQSDLNEDLLPVEVIDKLRRSVPDQWLRRHFPALSDASSFQKGKLRISDLPGTALLLLEACDSMLASQRPKVEGQSLDARADDGRLAA